MIIERFLSACNHKNKVFAQLNGQTLPIVFKQTVSHIQITVGGQFPEVAVQKQIKYSERSDNPNIDDFEMNVFNLLKFVKT